MINKGLFTSSTDEWATPQDFFRTLDEEFHFTLDPCSTDNNAKCKLHYTLKDNGLEQDWGGANCVLQPSVWQNNQRLGTEGIRGIHKAKHYCGYAYPCKN